MLKKLFDGDSARADSSPCLAACLMRCIVLFDTLIEFAYNKSHHCNQTNCLRRNAMKLKPLHDWAVIVPSEAGERTAGGLYIPDTAKEKPEEGVVEAIGPGAYEQEKRGKKKEEKKERKFIPTTVKPGDRVLYEKYAGQTYKINNEERILVRERDILGLLDRPLQIPAATSHSSPTAIAERAAPSPGMKARPTKKTAIKKSAKKAVGKAAKKPSVKPARSSKSKKAGKKR